MHPKTKGEIPVGSKVFSGEAVVSPFCLILQLILGGRYKIIQVSDDLNDPKFRECGYVYICAASTTGKTLVNTPDDGNFGAFRLEIVPCAGTDFPMQRIYYARRNSPRIYVRYYENEWGEWKQLAFNG